MSERQRIERVSRRRVRLTPAPGTTAEPGAEPTDATAPDGRAAAASGFDAGPNDDRLRRDVPPHY